MVTPQDDYVKHVHEQNRREFPTATWPMLIPAPRVAPTIELIRAYPGSFDESHKNNIDYMFDWLIAHVNQIDMGWIDCIFLEQLRPFFQDLRPENLRERKLAYRDHYLAAIAKDKES